MTKNNEQHYAVVALIGMPNAGKSTLTNALLGQKLSIVSPKVQTTRNTIKAIVIEGQTQLVILDTPGIFLPRSDKIMERTIVKAAWQGVEDAEIICFLIDVSVGLNHENKRIITELKAKNIEPIIILNKIDLVKKFKLLEIIKELDEFGLREIFFVSAKEQVDVDKLKFELCKKAPIAPWIYDGENITDAPMKFVASEITREKLFLKLDQELPYSVTVKTDSYEIFENGEIKIHQTIFVLKESQKTIILGKNGRMISEIGAEARHDIGAIADAKVHLFLFVKVKKDWMQDAESYESY